MARQEVPKEDLIAQATALVRRIEFRTGSDQPLIVVGFRKDDSASIYFGEHPVYQFNSNHELRRAHIEAGMLKAEQRELVRMEKRRTESEVQLIRHVLSADEKSKLLDDIRSRFDEISDSIEQGLCEVTRQVPEGEPILGSVHQWIKSLDEIVVAEVPNAI
ncbi:MAG: hypothetical protein AAF497_10200 [Planctomycetota bacterium]